MILDDTIIAISSAVGPASRIILRTSGPSTKKILHDLGCAPSPQGSSRQRITIKGMSLPATIWQFISPKSYTGQDLAEIHLPGNPLLARLVMERAMELGARAAEPGEFTSRAYFNGKLDLTQAEGIAASISARSAAELAAARQLMSGQLARRLRPIMDQITDTAALVEVGIDFSEEDVEFLSRAQVQDRLNEIDQELNTLAAQSSRFEKLAHESTLVLCGRPNAGKSTLANTLAGKNRSVVSPIPGTTRDILAVEVFLPRGKIRLLDVAGFEKNATSEIDSQMQDQATRAIEESDFLIEVRETADDQPLELPRPPDLSVRSKADLPQKVSLQPGEILISALSGLNMAELRIQLDRLAFGAESPGTKLALTARHLAAIDHARQSIADARAHSDSPELLAADLRASLDALGQILGLVTPDDVLGKIFSTFCIGK
jgi:tRNA modification GTPase